MTLRLLSISLFAAGALSLAAEPADPAPALATILSEDFELFADGSAETPADAEISAGGNIDTSLTHGLQWKGRGLHSAGGALAVMHFEQSDWFGTQSVQGYVQTPWTDVRMDGGQFSLRFKARTMSAQSEKLHIEVYDPYTTNSLDAATAEIGNEWNVYEVALQHPGYGNHLAFMQIASEGEDWLLDDLCIVQSYYAIMPPIAHFARNVTHEHFTANWNEVPLATGYLLSAFSLDDAGQREYIVENVSTDACEYTVEGTVRGTQYYYTVRSVNDLYTSDETEPVKVNVPLTALDTPLTLETTEVSTDSFIARWEPTFRAMGYILNLKRSRIATADEEYAVVSEDFDKCKGYEGYPDFPAPFYDNLDDFTSVPGWKAPNGAVSLDGMFGLDNMWKKYEEISLTSPALDLSAGGGRFAVHLDVKCDAGITVNVSCGDLTRSHTVAGGSDDFSLDFDNGTAATVIKIEFDGDGYLFFDRISICQTAAAGDVISENIGSYDTGEPVEEYKFENLGANAGDIYTYTVTAWSYSLGEDGVWGPNVYSEASAPRSVVIPDPSGVDNIVGAADSITVSGNEINVTATETSTLELYDIAGNLLSRTSIAAGTTSVNAPCRGIIIARLGTTVRKLAL